MGGSTDPYPLYSTRSSLDFKEGLMGHLLELFPYLGEVKVLRQWAGMADMTPDFSPVMGITPIENYYIDAGWGTWGFKQRRFRQAYGGMYRNGQTASAARSLCPVTISRVRSGRRKRSRFRRPLGQHLTSSGSRSYGEAR